MSNFQLAVISSEVKKIREYAEKPENRWSIRVMPDGQIEQYYKHDIVVEPLTAECTLPRAAVKRAQETLLVAQVEEWVIVHEVPPPAKPLLTEEQKAKLTEASKLGLKAAAVVGAVLGVAALLLVGALAAGLCGEDPALLARVKTPHGDVWVEIFRYYE